MQYRSFGRNGFEVSALGFGCMRLPLLDDDPSHIDEDQATRMIRYAVDRGVNYVDTAYPYHRGRSEEVVGRILKDGYRSRVILATKCPVWLVESTGDFDKYLDEQLTRLDTDFFDIYLLHALDQGRWQKARSLGALDFLSRALKDGRIKYAGFSFHDNLTVFKEIVDSYDWTMCQIMLNYVNPDFQAGVQGMKYAARKGIAVAVMEPLLGGKLAANIPPRVQELLRTSGVKRSPIEWALQWVWNHPEVSVVLSGMGSMNQVVENVSLAERALPSSLSAFEDDLLSQARAAYRSQMRVGCSGCEYCMPCPNNVLIPDIFQLYNEMSMYGVVAQAQQSYGRLSEAKKDAAQCGECGACEEACPQHLPVRKHLKEAHAALSR